MVESGERRSARREDLGCDLAGSWWGKWVGKRQRKVKLVNSQLFKKEGKKSGQFEMV